MFTKHTIAAVAFALTASFGTFASTSNAGGINGRVSGNGRVEANSTNSYDLAFKGGEIARIDLAGDTDTDLDLYVYDADGQLVARDIDYSDRATVVFFVPSNQIYTVRIVNLGNVWNGYSLSTN